LIKEHRLRLIKLDEFLDFVSFTRTHKKRCVWGTALGRDLGNGLIPR